MHGNRRAVRPLVERIEERQLLSGITAVLASKALHADSPPQISAASLSTAQAPPNNEFLNPTGVPTPHEFLRRNFVAKAYGTFTVGPGRTSTENKLVLIRLRDGFSPYSLHIFGQVGLVTLNDPTAPTSGAISIFDKNINSNTVVGLDLTGSPADVDAHGRPTRLNFTTDFNTSAGVFVESISQGAVNIRYLPDGNAVVVIRGQVYTLGTNQVLHNQLIQRGGIPHTP